MALNNNSKLGQDGYLQETLNWKNTNNDCYIVRSKTWELKQLFGSKPNSYNY